VEFCPEEAAMTRVVHCVVLNREAEGLEGPPHPGELGQRIFETVSKQGWQQWLDRLTMIINENGLNTGDPQSLELIENHMRGFLFKEGDYGGMPQGFRPPGAKK
jgi:Fe-S cluster biosynthesis and repair protein YggX